MARSAGREVALHNDSGLQPERTSLAWGRTMLLLVATASLFLRWYPRHGLFVASLVGVALAAALGIWLSQRRRYRHGALAVAGERFDAALLGVFGLAASVIVLALLGGFCVIWLV